VEEEVVAKVLDSPLEAEVVMGNHLVEELEGIDLEAAVEELEVDDVVDLGIVEVSGSVICCMIVVLNDRLDFDCDFGCSSSYDVDCVHRGCMIDSDYARDFDFWSLRLLDVCAQVVKSFVIVLASSYVTWNVNGLGRLYPSSAPSSFHKIDETSHSTSHLQ
jgi:hypothetical protein